jgi:hypothetical protein
LQFKVGRNAIQAEFSILIVLGEVGESVGKGPHIISEK